MLDERRAEQSESDVSGHALASAAKVQYRDPVPRRITFDEWSVLFRSVPDELIQEYRYFRGTDQPWSTYLFPPLTYALYGARHLRRLKFDNSLAALRLWGFVMTETERLFRAGQTGRRVVATMGDLGGTPPLVLAAGALPFYPDCIWWVPFMNESTVLFDAAAKMGIGETACYSRATLGAFLKGSYFPRPALCIAGTGASCDDYSAVEQLVASLGFPVHWFELPLRKDSTLCGKRHEETAVTPSGTEYQVSARTFLVEQFRALQLKLGVTDAERIRSSIAQVNRVRVLVQDIKRMVYSAPASVFPALEMMVIEFGNLHFYSDIFEWSSILEHIRATIAERVANRQYLGPETARRIAWVTPPADPLLLSYAEDQELRVVASEYVINQALHPIAVNGDPLSALAENLLNGSLLGSSRARAQAVIDQAREFGAEGVIISGILGGSHCAIETWLIRDYMQEALDLPVLAFDVPSPASAVSSQIRTRVEAFGEVLKGRR